MSFFNIGLVAANLSCLRLGLEHTGMVAADIGAEPANVRMFDVLGWVRPIKSSFHKLWAEMTNIMLCSFRFIPCGQTQQVSDNSESVSAKCGIGRIVIGPPGCSTALRKAEPKHPSAHRNVEHVLSSAPLDAQRNRRKACLGGRPHGVCKATGLERNQLRAKKFLVFLRLPMG